MRMCVFKGTPLLFYLLLRITAEAVGHSPAVVAKYKKTTILACDDVKTDTCNDISWSFRGLKKPNLLKLVERGRIIDEKSFRWRLRNDCSLVIISISDKDVGNYSCSDASSGRRRGVTVSVVKGENVIGNVEKNCSLLTPEFSRFTVKSRTNKSTERTKIRLINHTVINFKRSLKCTVSDKLTGKTWNFDFSMIESTEFITIEPPTFVSTLISTPDKSATVPHIKPQSADKTKTQALYIVSAEIVAAVLVLIILIVMWKRHKETEVKRSNSDAFLEKGIFYTSVDIQKRPVGKDSAEIKQDEDDTTVTYSSVKTPSSSPPIDPTALYASVNKPKTQKTSA